MAIPPRGTPQARGRRGSAHGQQGGRPGWRASWPALPAPHGAPHRRRRPNVWPPAQEAAAVRPAATVAMTRRWLPGKRTSGRPAKYVRIASSGPTSMISPKPSPRSRPAIGRDGEGCFRARLAPEHPVIARRGGPQPTLPLLAPPDGPPGLLGQLLRRPVGMGTQHVAQQAAGGGPVRRHGHPPRADEPQTRQGSAGRRLRVTRWSNRRGHDDGKRYTLCWQR